MSQPKGFFKKRNAQGEMTTRPIISGDSKPYVEPEMQIQVIERKPEKRPMIELLKQVNETATHVGRRISEEEKKLAYRNSPEGQIEAAQRELDREAAKQALYEQREELMEKQVELADRKRQIKQLQMDKAVQEGTPANKLT